MDIHKLHIFSKNTDAFASQRGYNYQTLKTLESWVQNFIDKKQEIIYCEFEEDIFHKDFISKEAKFKQIKLYSNNFSFKSNEIKKSIVNFFLLHIKSDYSDFKKEFIFETNSNIVRDYDGNDASLLKEWFNNQFSLSEVDLKKYSNKVKEIVSEYIKKQEKNYEIKLIKEASEIFNKLNDEFWNDFTRLIKWDFKNTNPDDEFSNTIKKIKSLITKIPISSVSDDKNIFSSLLETVFVKVTNSDYNERTLTFRKFENTILSLGEKEDGWYSRKFNYYLNIESIDSFRFGEFYEILDLINYCRRKKYLHHHKEKWNALTNFYLNTDSISPYYRRKIIYELIFLNNEFHEVDYENLSARIRPDGNLFGFENHIRYYLEDFKNFITPEDLEDAKNIINILFPVVIDNKINIDKKEHSKWVITLFKEISKRLTNSSNSTERCKYLELKATFLMVSNISRGKNPLEFIKYYDELIENLDKSPLYEVSQLGDRLNKYIKMFINSEPDDTWGLINALEEFSTRLFPYIEKREGKISLAKQQVQRGVQYIKTNKKHLLLKALDYFHKAKINYLQEDTIEGYTLGLINISQLYNKLGLHLAAKYYALASFRISINKELINRVENSFELLFYSDYKSGSWLNAIDIYSKYIFTREQSNYEKSDFEHESKITRKLTFLLYVMLKKSNHFNDFVTEYINSFGYIGNDIINPILKKYDEFLPTENHFNQFLIKEVNDYPLNDIGTERVISFKALGSLWRIKFPNKYELIGISEEFISNLQILLAEISLFEVDFHLLKTEIEIELELSKEYKEPEELPSNEVIKRKVFIVKCNSKNEKKLNFHTVHSTISVSYILNSMSLLKYEEFQSNFMDFIKERELDNKQISVNIYQKIHRDVYSKKSFKEFKNQKLNNFKIDLDFIKDNEFMKWNHSLSHKYNYEDSIFAIKTRFENTYKGTYLTILKLKKDKKFILLINKLRKDGWKDWQIISNIFNFIVDYKVRVFEAENLKGLDEKSFREKYHELFYKYVKLDEKDCYIYFPVEAFESKEFEFQFNISIVAILNRFQLECKLQTPAFKAIREFLNIKFNLNKDDYHVNNPLKNL
ncbi:hypothetical protein [Polaribacter porphyrae]|uniref:CD-NTase associated protein 4-like DNA endonuclease domain-containing protein n=1 Tax=Polaribacter porphyrae TaxID=1137780 RepID=A0A2S7WPM1_9FLAO|nr:hypothetical protein [Polaribacter porphyrae]PQJ79558.1 hypothetical protein BTO18_10410 [Polaribacter porphyrae]